MKKSISKIAFFGLIFGMIPNQAAALSPETEMLLELLKTKGVISQSDADSFKKTIETKMPGNKTQDEGHRHSVQSLASRLDKLEKATPSEAKRLADKVVFSGFVEVEATGARKDAGNGAITRSNDINLATAELDLDATINPYVTGHLAFLYEESAGDNIALDEGIISISGGDKSPFYLNAGKMYVPFGQFESHFITHPLPLTIGETNDTALLLGYSNLFIEVNASAFNGAINEAGKGDYINSYTGSITITIPENAFPDLSANIGVSYLSNLATSDELQTQVNSLTNKVGAYSAFGHFEYLDKFFLDIEYLSALDDFAVTDLKFTDLNNRKPKAWNVELAAAVMPKFELALRYGGTDEVGIGSDYAEDMYGVALLYDVLDNTAITFELLKENFSDYSDSQSATLQLAVEF